MLPQLRENAWLNYPPPAVSSQFIDPPRYEPPPPGKHYPREHRSSQNCKGRNKNWQNRKRGNDNWTRRDKFKQVRLQKHQLMYPGDPLFVTPTIKKEDEEQKDETLQNEQPSESVSVDSSKQTVTESGSINDEQVQKNTVPEESPKTSANEIKTEVKEPLEMKEPVEVKEEPIEVKEQQMEFDEEIKAANVETISTFDLCAVVENTSIKEEEPRPKCKMVVLKSRGIVMKVRADSIAMPALPVSVSKIVPSENVDIEEMEYPPPDLRFKVLPPVQRGTELSGLCSIM